MNSIRIFLMVFVMLLGAVCVAVPTADSVEDDAEFGWGITPGNVTYLDFPMSADGYTTTRGGLTLTRDADDSWGDPDDSNRYAFVNEYGLDDKLWNDANDLLITITGLAADTEYGIALSVKGNINHPTEWCDYGWGSEAQGGPINGHRGVPVQENAVQLSGSVDGFGTDDYLYAVPLYKATSDATGTVKVWIGRYGHSFFEPERTQMDGLFVGTEIPAWATSSTIAWKPTPEDEGTNVAIDTDLSWDGPSDANNLWTYDVYFGDTYPPAYLTTVSGAEPNVPNSALPTLTLGTYYWKVDSNDPNGQPTRVGEDWTFEAGVPLPELIEPVIGADPNYLSVVLRWDSDDESVNSGLIVKHRIILKNTTDGTEGQSLDKDATQEDYYLANPDLWDIVDYDKDYTWQVIELGAGDVVLAEGPAWPLRTKALACTGFTVWGDYTGDCTANLEDVAWLAAAWLECGWQRPGGLAVPYPEKDPCNW